MHHGRCRYTVLFPSFRRVWDTSNAWRVHAGDLSPATDRSWVIYGTNAPQPDMRKTPRNCAVRRRCTDPDESRLALDRKARLQHIQVTWKDLGMLLLQERRNYIHPFGAPLLIRSYLEAGRKGSSACWPLLGKTKGHGALSMFANKNGTCKPWEKMMQSLLSRSGGSEMLPKELKYRP